MNTNNAKNEMIDDLNKLMGILISLRTVETSPLNSNHWVNAYIDSLSNLRYKAVDNQDICSFCDGSGADYPPHAESMADAVACPFCSGYGFLSNKEVQSELKNILLEATNNRSVVQHIQLLLEKKLYQL